MEEIKPESEVNDLAVEMLSVLCKVLHALQHSNMKGTILHQEITAVVKKGMISPLRIRRATKP